MTLRPGFPQKVEGAKSSGSFRGGSGSKLGACSDLFPHLVEVKAMQERSVVRL